MSLRLLDTYRYSVHSLKRTIPSASTIKNFRLFCAAAWLQRSYNKDFVFKQCKELRNGIYPSFFKTPNSNLRSVLWNSPPENVFVVTKPEDSFVVEAALQFMQHTCTRYSNVNIIINDQLAKEVRELIASKRKDKDDTYEKILSEGSVYTGSMTDIVQKTDLIVTLGGDGTILRALSGFLNLDVPPVLSFAMGTLGFLLPFDFCKFPEVFDEVYWSRAKAMNRRRLECTWTTQFDRIPDKEHVRRLSQSHNSFGLHAVNEISLHRGSQTHLLSLDIFIDGEFLTTATGDGIILATPTGSTAYSLSAGGSIAHPLVPCIILTPISPMSLSFRPLILPATSQVTIRLSENNRNNSIELSVDGLPQSDLAPGDLVSARCESPVESTEHNEPNPYSTLASHLNRTKPSYQFSSPPVRPPALPPHLKGIWCIARGEHDWTKDINELLGFNASFKALKR